MFLLLLVNLAIALLATALVILLFRGPIAGILSRIVQDPVAAAWRRYLIFALLVVGVSSGVNPWRLERYRTGGMPDAPEPMATFPLDSANWALEIYGTVISSFRGLALALFLFFGIGLIVSAVLRASEQRAVASGLGTDRLAAVQRARNRERELTSRGRDRTHEPRRMGTDARSRRGGEGRARGEAPLRGGADIRGGAGRGGGESRGGEGRGGEGRGGESRGGEGRGGERGVTERGGEGPWEEGEGARENPRRPGMAPEVRPTTPPPRRF